MPIGNMGTLNAGWGICGFTSSLCALYTNSPTQRVRLSGAGATPTMMLAEIKSYLRYLQAEGRHDLLDAIQAFTRSFGGTFSAFTISGYIAMINGVVALPNGPDVTDGKFGIAMPPLCVVDYLQRVCDFRNARIVDLSSGASELILGVCGTSMPLYGGLEHYLYLRNGIIHSWGQQFASVADAATAVGSTWTVGYKIAVA